MKRSMLFTAIFLLAAASLAAQNTAVQDGEKPRLAVVPFSGGEGDDGENIAELFSGSRDLAQVFRIYPRTSITFGIDEERNVQKYVVSNKEYRNQLLAMGINYVVAGDITKLGQQSLLVISIIDIEKLVQIAGDVQIFEKKQEIEGKLPEMVRNIINGAKIDWTKKPMLAVVNPRLRDNANPQAANVLGEILGIEITRTGKYAVYPRNTTLEAVQTEWDNQRRGAAASKEPKGPGSADRPDYVLSVIARGGEGSATAARFNASITSLDTREQVSFATQGYPNIEDGIKVMRTIARELTITEAERLAEEKAAADQRAQREQAARKAERAREWAAWWKEREDYAFRSSMNVLVAFSFLWADEDPGFSCDIIGFHWSFLPFTSVGLQGVVGALEAGDIDKDNIVDDIGIGGVIFNAGLVFPLTTNDGYDPLNVSLYGDGLLEINMVELEGLLAKRVTPGFDAGISFMWGKINDMRLGFDITYRGLWYKDRYLNAIGIGMTMGFDGIGWND